MAITSVRRDPFARAGYLRQSEASAETRECCRWCGAKPRTLYRYSGYNDGFRAPRLYWSPPFCNLACLDAYQY